MRIISFLVSLGCASLVATVVGSGQPPASQPASPGQPPAPPPPPPPAVKVGEPALDFTLAYLAPAAEGRVESKSVKLGDFKGKQNVVLAFFPAAFSPG